MTLVLWRRRLWTPKKEKKAYETGLCILLFNGDRQVSSVNCPSALWYLLPIFAGFRIYLKSIWALQKRGTSSFCHHDRRASITRGSLSIWRRRNSPSGPMVCGIIPLKHTKKSHSVWFSTAVTSWLCTSMFMCVTCSLFLCCSYKFIIFFSTHSSFITFTLALDLHIRLLNKWPLSDVISHS